MFWNHKKQPNPGATLSPTLKLWQISARLYFDGDRKPYRATVSYAESPKGGYKERGLEQEREIVAQSWPELRSAIDGLLDGSHPEDMEKK